MPRRNCSAPASLRRRGTCAAGRSARPSAWPRAWPAGASRWAAAGGGGGGGGAGGGGPRGGVALLLDDLGLTIRDLEAVLIAGTFGSYLRKASALAIGLVPPIDPELVRFVGNAAGAGARLVLVDQRARRRAIRLARRAESIELAGHPGYQEAFCSAIPFPDPGARSGRAGP